MPDQPTLLHRRGYRCYAFYVPWERLGSEINGTHTFWRHFPNICLQLQEPSLPHLPLPACQFFLQLLNEHKSLPLGKWFGLSPFGTFLRMHTTSTAFTPLGLKPPPMAILAALVARIGRGMRRERQG